MQKRFVGVDDGEDEDKDDSDKNVQLQLQYRGLFTFCPINTFFVVVVKTLLIIKEPNV